MVGLESVDSEAPGIREASFLIGSEQSALAEMGGDAVVLTAPGVPCPLSDYIHHGEASFLLQLCKLAFLRSDVCLQF